MKEGFSVLINTTDSFEDCWIPFFTLFRKFWPEYAGPIYLNTETKSFSFRGLNIVSVRNNKDSPGKRVTWSECLIRALASIDSEIVLYMQEDYFLNNFVQHDLVCEYVSLMIEHKDIHCIHLTDQAVTPGSHPSNYKRLYPVQMDQQYSVSCQAALWRKEVLMDYLRPYEDAWNFEELGSQRAALLHHNFYVVDSKFVRINQFEIIPYVFTGIIKGHWNKAVVPLFQQNGILVDYSKRGFGENVPRTSFFRRLTRRCKRILVLHKHSCEIRKLRKYDN